MSTDICFIPNIKALGLMASDEKSFYSCFHYISICKNMIAVAEPLLAQGTSFERTRKKLNR